MKKTNCPIHGEKGIGLVCIHITQAIAKGEKVGFYWGDDEDLSRPDAWCSDCEEKLISLNGASSEQWFIDADFKVVCTSCWDEAKAVCGGIIN